MNEQNWSICVYWCKLLHIHITLFAGILLITQILSVGLYKLIFSYGRSTSYEGDIQFSNSYRQRCNKSDQHKGVRNRNSNSLCPLGCYWWSQTTKKISKQKICQSHRARKCSTPKFSSFPREFEFSKFGRYSWAAIFNICKNL